MTIPPQPRHHGSAEIPTGGKGAYSRHDDAAPERACPKEKAVLDLASIKATDRSVEDAFGSTESPASPKALPLWLLLVGREVVHRHWGLVTGAGIVWTALGGALVIDALDGATHIPDRWFGLLLVFEAAGSFVRGLVATGAARRLRILKAALLLVVAVLTMLASSSSTFLLAMLFGTAFLFDGLSRFALANVLRFPGWRLSAAHGALVVALGIITLQPWPTWYAGTVGFCIGAFLMLAGIKVAILGARMRHLPAEPLAQAPDAHSDALTVHVWTPTGTATIPARQRLVHRYVVSVNGRGHVSTGHAALELGAGVTEDALYVSHYPAVEIDRSPDNLRATLRAGPENDVPGRFLPSYREEADDWCEATVTVTLRGVDAARLRHFWAAYRRDATYNLVGRNCSTTVASALDAAVEGAFNRDGKPWRHLARAVMSPEFWAAAILRNGAGAMTWTPGLVLDYSRALSALVDPVSPVPAIRWEGVRRRLLRNWRAETVARMRNLGRRRSPAA
ncbi:HdeD family acid-resistance protein [Methylobacterium marchantiae]|uniref:HdeD family acid-resistance protein n=1 Tax=Methylobacterium marchantiae TaxID=600331 RepID=A0ABW3X0M3_9HYPH